jgi:hypothetical protein
MTTKLSENFTLEELFFSQTAVRKGIPNTPNPQQIQNLQELCKNVLERMIGVIWQRFHINSGYRGAQLNTAIGGAKASKHLEGKAADIVCPTIGTLPMFKAIVKSDIVFDQLIFEGTWVHISYDPVKNRHEILKATFGSGPVTYTKLTKEQALALKQ